MKKKRSNLSIINTPFSFFSAKTQNNQNSGFQGSNPSTTFKDVAGLEEIKEELMEISDFLINPNKYKKFGAKIPRGIMFYGPPGTGKTLIARALAGQTNAGFIYASGSEFIEKFVGVGASRIRTLFEKAYKKAPCIVFIDEIDAIGVSRNTDNNSERDQTLNQFLIELDGFKQTEGVVIIAATNRIDMLDKALLRPGRFDRQIFIGNPSKKAREEIIKTHLKGKSVSNKVIISSIASRTHGLSGAHLANIVNEATLLAIRKSHRAILNEDFDEAIIKVSAGLKNKSLILGKKEKEIVSYHEAGHALAGYLLTGTLPNKISIIPHGEALGFVLTSSIEDKYVLTKKELLDQITILLAGRASEEIIFSEISTGAHNDLQKANEVANAMVCDYGMSKWENQTFNYREDLAFINNINKEINRILNVCYDDSKKLLLDNVNVLHQLASILERKEEISQKELEVILKPEYI